MRDTQTQQLLDSYCSDINKWIFPIVYLYGEIGTGKSTVLQEALLDTMKTKHNLIVVELDCVEIKNHSWMFYNVMRQIQKQCRTNLRISKVLNFYSFATAINTVVQATDQQIAIALDNIHLLDKKNSIHLITYLLQLHELTNGDACIIATSRVPWDRFIQGLTHSTSTALLLSGFTPLQIYFEQYSNKQVETILKQLHPQQAQNMIFSNFLQAFVYQVYPYVRNVPEIGQHVPRVFEKFNNARDQFSNRWSLKAFQHSQIKAEMKEIMGLSHTSAIPTSKEEDDDALDQLQLSKIQKYILVAVFIGSRVHNKMDGQYFDRNAGVGKKGRKTNKTVTVDSSRGKKGLNDIPLSRLLAITQSLMFNQDEKDRAWTRLDLMQQISTLCSMHYLERSSADVIDLDQPVFRLSPSGNIVSFDTAKKLAGQMGVSLAQFNITQ